MPTWRKSSYSNAELDCVEVALLPVEVGVRDSKDVRGGELRLSEDAWAALLRDLS
jgi:hypothetical protein